MQGGMGLAAVSLLGVPLRVSAAPCGTTTWDLIAGQTINVGTVTVSNDATNVYVTYTLTKAGCTFGTLHVWVGSDLANLPANQNGTPIPGHFPHHHDATGLTTYTFTIPLNDKFIGIKNVCSPSAQTLYVVTHAEVCCETKCDSHETAFGGPIPGPGPRWWFYGQYTVCCEEPPVTEICETAFAKGGYVFVTDPRSNPEGLPSLNLIRNRWGWAINLTRTGTTTYDIWAGAGLNRTSNGTKVGVLTIVWDGTTAKVTYDITAAGCLLQEVHLYAGDAKPTTTAPGQYGNLAYLDPKAITYTFDVPLANTDGKDGVWLIAHAVVCCQAKK